MSDPKRASLITECKPKSAKNNVKKTVRLTINLEESTESNYPELNYKELVKAALRKKSIDDQAEILIRSSDEDENVKRLAKEMERKYGGKSTYAKKGQGKFDDFADIGAGYDEDSFIDNTDGYDELIPSTYDTILGGFYINCGLLDFKPVADKANNASSDVEQSGSSRRNKRRLSSSSESCSSSSDSDSRDTKRPEPIPNGNVDSHETEHRKKKNKKTDKKKAKKIRRTDSSAATSGKQTSDDNAHHGDGESADSRTSQSDSLTSKPAPSSENAITSDSSRDAEPKGEVKLPAPSSQLQDPNLDREDVHRNAPSASSRARKTSTKRLSLSAHHQKTDDSARDRPPSQKTDETVRDRLPSSQKADDSARDRPPSQKTDETARDCLPSSQKTDEPARENEPVVTPAVAAAQLTSATTTVTTVPNEKHRELEDLDVSRLTADEKEAKILEMLQQLKAIVDEREPGMIQAYNAEVQERKKLQGDSASRKPVPKRRFPWCSRSRGLLSRLVTLTEEPHKLLAQRVLPLFPASFAPMTTLLKQAGLQKVKVRSATQTLPVPAQPSFSESIQFPSSLTVTTSIKSDKPDFSVDAKYKVNAETLLKFGSILNSHALKEKTEERKKDVTDKHKGYIPPNIGSITITPVPKEPFIRVKSPAALNDMVKKKDDKLKKDKVTKDRRVESPIYIDTTVPANKKEPSPKKFEEVNPKQIEAMRLAECNIPRPALVAVGHSPTFAKPDKRPPDVRKKKDIVIMSDLDPLGDSDPEPVVVDDNSSDVEEIQITKDKSEKDSDKSDLVPSKDKVSTHDSVRKSVSSSKDRKCMEVEMDKETRQLFDTVENHLRELKNSQQQPQLNCISYGDSVITSERTPMNNAEKCNAVTG